MNIATLPTTQKIATTQTNTHATTKSKDFSSFFGQVKSSINKPAQTEAPPAPPTTMEAVEDVLGKESLDALLDILDIQTDESMLFAIIGENEQPIALDQMLTLEDLSIALGLTEEELTSIVQKLVGDEQPITDVWSLIEQAPTILSEIISVLMGNHQSVTPKEAQQVVKALKLSELLGVKTDTVYMQEVQLSQMKDSLQTTLAQVQQAMAQQTSVQQEMPKKIFQQVIHQVVQQTQQETEVTQTTTVQQQTTLQTKTVTVTLPAEKPAQSEALLKEIQNIINRGQLSGQQGNMKLLLKLYPENLGQIRIELIQKDGVLTARLLTSTSLGKDLLDTNLNQLKSAFVAQNIQMDRIDIMQSLQDATRNTRDQNLFSNFFRQQGEETREETKDNDEDEKTFSEFLNEEV